MFFVLAAFPAAGTSGDHCPNNRFPLESFSKSPLLREVLPQMLSPWRLDTVWLATKEQGEGTGSWVRYSAYLGT